MLKHISLATNYCVSKLDTQQAITSHAVSMRSSCDKTQGSLRLKTGRNGRSEQFGRNVYYPGKLNNYEKW